MKKIILLLTASLSVGSVLAQSNANGSIVFKKAETVYRQPISTSEMPFVKRNTNSANKGTATDGAWFSYLNIMFNQASSKSFVGAMQADSNVLYTYSNGTSNIFYFGFGQSFDPADSVFFGGDNNGMMSSGTVADPSQLPPFKLQPFDAYSIDSVGFSLQYNRNDNTAPADTLVITLVKVPKTSLPFGVFNLRYNAGTLPDVTPGGAPGFCSAIYDPNTNMLSDSIPSSAKMTWSIVMDAAFIADTTANGWSNRTQGGLALPSTLNMAAGEKLIGYVTIKWGKTYPLNTPSGSANTALFLSSDISGVDASPKQNVNSVQCGLVATRQSKYGSNHFEYQGHNLVIPNIAYSTDGSTVDFAWHVKCTSCWDVSASKINNNFNMVKAYPNPASSEVSVSFRLNKAANVNVTLTNTVGQVVGSKSIASSSNGVAAFPTSGLANGVYFYTVEANGQRQTGRVVVSH